MNNLCYRRQFLLSPKICNQLENWQHNKIGLYNLYTHPEIDVTLVKRESDNVEMALVGYIIDPANPNGSNMDILETISSQISIESIGKKLYPYTGRYVLLIKIANNYFAFHDPCGLRQVFYTQFENQQYLASQPLLLKLVVPVKEGNKFKQYHGSKYKKSELEHWIPSGCSLYDDVYHLIPNHYLDFAALEQKRYWPDQGLSQITLEEAIERTSVLLKKIMIACNARFSLALPLTGGFDSRAILSASKEIAGKVYFYTLQYRGLTDNSYDIRIPRNILSALRYPHTVIDCREPIDQDFAKIYESNSDMSHLNDWGVIAYGMLKYYPSDRVMIKGNCSEIARCGYYAPSGKHQNIVSAKQLINYMPGWDQLDFVREQVSKWFLEIKDPERNFGYDVLDLFYWEHRIGSWQAQSQLEWDIVQDSVTPFNHREFMDIALAVNVKYRRHPDYILYQEVMRNLWKETLIEPFNPKPFYHKIKVLFDVIKKQIQLKLYPLAVLNLTYDF